MIPNFANGLAKLIAACILIAAMCHAVEVIQDIVALMRSVESEGSWLRFGSRIAVWAFAVSGAFGILQNKALGYYAIYLATLLLVFGEAFSYIPFSSFWLPKPLTRPGTEWVGIWLVDVVVIVTLLWCHCMTRMLRHDPRLKELREKPRD